MTAASYSFIDIAALDEVRARFARGEALLLLSADLATVLWVNGPGAALFGRGDIDALTDAPSPLGAVARRQLAALPGFPAIGAGRPVTLRVASGMSSRALLLQAATAVLPDGAPGILLAAEAQAGNAGETAARAIVGIAQPGQFAALVDGEGGFLAASAGMAELALPQRIVKRLAAEAALAPGHLVKRRVESGSRVLPAGFVHLSDEAGLLVVVDEGFVDFGEDLLARDEAEAFEAEGGDVLSALPAGEDSDIDGLSGPGLDITLAEEPAESWYFNERSGEAAAEGAARLAALQAGAPVRFTWRTDAEGRFRAVSPEFTAALGLAESDIVGRSFGEIARRFGFDRDGEVAGLLSRRDTWSGSTVLWPTADGAIAVPVDLAALPTYGRNRAFEGFRGFGVARVAEAVFRDGETEGDAPAPQADAPLPERQAAAFPPPAAPAAGGPSLKDQSDEVVRLLSEPRHAAAPHGLAPHERHAFDEIGKRLKEASPVAAASLALLAARPDRAAAQPPADETVEAAVAAAAAPDLTPPSAEVSPAGEEDAAAQDDPRGDLLPDGDLRTSPSGEPAAGLHEPAATDPAADESANVEMTRPFAEGEQAGEPDLAAASPAAVADAQTASQPEPEWGPETETEQPPAADEPPAQAPAADLPEATEPPVEAASAEWSGEEPQNTAVENLLRPIADEPSAEAPAAGLGDVADPPVEAAPAEWSGKDPQEAASTPWHTEESPTSPGEPPGSESDAPAANGYGGASPEGPPPEAHLSEASPEVETETPEPDAGIGMPLHSAAVGEPAQSDEPAEAVASGDETAAQSLPGGDDASSEAAAEATSAVAPEEREGVLDDAPLHEDEAKSVEPEEVPWSEDSAASLAASQASDSGDPHVEAFATSPIPPSGPADEADAGQDVRPEAEQHRDIAAIAGDATDAIPRASADEAPAAWPEWRAEEGDAPSVAANGWPAAAVPAAAGEANAERVEAEEAPAESSGTALLDHLPVPVLIHSGDLLHYANAEFLALSGYPSLEALREDGGLGALLDAPDAAGEERALRLRRADGEEFPVESLLRSAPWNGNKALLLVLRRLGAPPVPDGMPPSDAERRLAEMSAIVDTATDGVVLIAPDGVVRSISRPAEALFGLDSAEAAEKPFGALFAPESQRAVADYLDGLADNGVASVLNDGREVMGRERGGGLIPLFMTIGTLPGKSGFCAVLRDITQWKRAEEELIQSRALAERASSHKTEFLARVSHEIRTPLNAIIGFSELMLDEKFGAIGSDRYRDYLRDINRSGNHVLALVNDLLDISKIEAGQQEMAYEAVSLNDALSETVATMQPQANRERVIIRSSLAAALPEVVADHRSLRQIALNILSNAIRFTPAGGQVIVSTAQEASGDVVLRVRDTGIGMSQAEIEQALKPFKQINSLKRTRTDGTGLGLPLTKAMVEANRARFMIASTPGEGTLVEVLFPSTRVLV